MRNLTCKSLKIAATIMLALPTVFLGILFLSEGEAEFQNVLIVAPLVVLAWISWQRPLWGGIALVAIAITLMLISILLRQGTEQMDYLFILLLFYGAPIVGGILFIVASRRCRKELSWNASSSPPNDD